MVLALKLFHFIPCGWMCLSLCFFQQIKKIIQSGIDNPGNDNELKQLQLQQLAELNGTFKPIDVLRWVDVVCELCGCSVVYTRGKGK